MRRFDEMLPQLEPYGIEIFALSKDNVADAGKHAREDNLRVTLLCDPELEVIRQFGVEHLKALEFSTVRFRLFGMPLALIPSFKAMAIPTSMLIDRGTICWIDQSDDYRLRSDNDKILAAVTQHFDELGLPQADGID